MWPDGIQCGVCFTFDLDAETMQIDIDPANIDRPTQLSQGRYGPRVAIPLILSLLDERNVKSTFFIPGKAAEDHPKVVESIVLAGHELAGHGYTHTSPESLTKAEEEEQISRGRTVLSQFNVEVVGYRSPSYELSADSVSLLDDLNFCYSTNMMDDIFPYRHPDSEIIELPVQYLLDDWVHFGYGPPAWEKKIATNSEVREIWGAEFEGIYKVGGLIVLTMHPQVIGRPGRLQFLDEFMGFVAAHEGVWIGTCREIAEYAKSVLS